MADHPDLRAQLRAASLPYRPDRDRMLARVAAGVRAGTGPAPRPRSRPVWVPVAGAALSLLAALAVGGTTVSWVLGDGTARTVRTPPGAGSRLTADAVPTGASRSPVARSRPRTTTDGQLQVTARGVPGDRTDPAGSTLTLRARRSLTALTVELRIARASGVEFAGAWQSRPTAEVSLTVHEERDALVYRWTLRRGAAVPAGHHRFTARYRQPAGERNTGKDSYIIVGRGPTGSVTVHGDFLR